MEWTRNIDNRFSVSCRLVSQSINGCNHHFSVLGVVYFIDRNEKVSRENKKKTLLSNFAKIQQTHIKVQSRKITNHKAKFKLTQE